MVVKMERERDRMYPFTNQLIRPVHSLVDCSWRVRTKKLLDECFGLHTLPNLSYVFDEAPQTPYKQVCYICLA